MDRERRKNTRYKIEAGTFLVLSQENQLSGDLVTISSGGISCLHPEGQNPSVRKIDIVSSGDQKIFLLSAKVKPVYDIKILSEEKSFTGGNYRICGLQFMDLTEKQKTALKSIIGGHH
jgi:c-di-GMP-binding flagellar brake protein YcgR